MTRFRGGASVAAAFLAAFVLGPLVQLDFLRAIPGEIVDSRLNHYFLENIYQFFTGGSPSLWHLQFFAPLPYIIGFSDNLFGSAIAYLVPRWLGAAPETAFQLWYLVSYPLNFVASYVSLRQMGLRRGGATVGALIYTFALPVTAQANHAQLAYRFATPLAIAQLVTFLRTAQWSRLFKAAAWLTLQLYCTIYIGFFAGMAMGVIALTFVVLGALERGGFTRESLRALGRGFRAVRLRSRWVGLGLAGLLAALWAVLLYPYLQVSTAYGVSGNVQEIVTMLPRLQSFLMADSSWLYGHLSSRLPEVPMRHEHQLFIGAIPSLLVAIAILLGQSSSGQRSVALLSGSACALVGVTLFVGYSAWELVAWLPGLSAIRAMTRLVLVLLFPVGYLAGLGVQYITELLDGRARLVVVVAAVAMILEASAVTGMSYPVAEWRTRLEAAESRVPDQLPDGAILFFAQSGARPLAAEELDAMWVSLKRGVPTMNGYTSSLPPGFKRRYLADCSEIPNRVQAYLELTDRPAAGKEYRDLMSRVVPVGFQGCRGSFARWMGFN